MFQEITHEENKTLKDVTKRELAILIPIIVMIFWIGIYPNSFLRKMDVSVNHLLTQIGEKTHIVSNIHTQKKGEQSPANSALKIDIVSDDKAEW